MFEAKPLDEKVISRLGGLPRVRRWWSGVHPERGMITLGWSGWETVEEKDVVPIHIVNVTDEPGAGRMLIGGLRCL
jgi:hypothetical protein